MRVARLVLGGEAGPPAFAPVSGRSTRGRAPAAGVTGLSSGSGSRAAAEGSVPALAQPVHDVEAAARTELDVEVEHIGLRRAHRGNRFRDVAGLGCDAKVRHLAEHTSQLRARGRLIVNEHDGVGHAPSGKRTVTVTPAAGQQGSAVITVTVSDGANPANRTFTVTAGIPAIAPVADQFTPVNVALGPMPVALSHGALNPEQLSLSAASSNDAVVPDGNLVLGGSGATRTLAAFGAQVIRIEDPVTRGGWDILRGLPPCVITPGRVRVRV